MKKKLTIRELLNSKGKRKISMTNAADANTAKACELAGIDIVGGRGGRTVEQMCAVLDDLAAPFRTPCLLSTCRRPMPG